MRLNSIIVFLFMLICLLSWNVFRPSVYSVIAWQAFWYIWFLPFLGFRIYDWLKVRGIRNKGKPPNMFVKFILYMVVAILAVILLLNLFFFILRLIIIYMS